MIKEWIRWFVAYLEWGFNFLLEQIMTVEGVVAMLFGLFIAGLISRIRS